jgi:hypothetical protein
MRNPPMVWWSRPDVARRASSLPRATLSPTAVAPTHALHSTRSHAPALSRTHTPPLPPPPPPPRKENVRLVHHHVKRFTVERTNINPAVVASVLSLMISTAELPLYVHCLDGMQATGVVVMCLRKLQHWSIPSILAEYARYAEMDGVRSVEPHCERFVSDFNEEVVVTEALPQWLWSGGARLAAHPTVKLRHNPPLSPTEKGGQRGGGKGGMGGNDGGHFFNKMDMGQMGAMARGGGMAEGWHIRGTGADQSDGLGGDGWGSSSLHGGPLGPGALGQAGGSGDVVSDLAELRRMEDEGELHGGALAHDHKSMMMIGSDLQPARPRRGDGMTPVVGGVVFRTNVPGFAEVDKGMSRTLQGLDLDLIGSHRAGPPHDTNGAFR